MVGAPPVVRLITQLERCLMIFRNGAKASGLWSGWPVLGLRACRWTIAAPASAASTAASAISCGVTGRAFDIEGVWIAPVTAQVMMTLRLMSCSPCCGANLQDLAFYFSWGFAFRVALCSV